jgi:hypothetical protein
MMNKRIEELAKQATIWHGMVDGYIFDKEKFAELIVKECINTIDPQTGTKWIKDQTQEEFWKNQSVHLIKQHFGVD